MACIKRQRTGHCSHSQCPFPHETKHGYECIEIIFSYCEAGGDCLEKCDYSWKIGTEEEEHADKAFKIMYPEV